MSRQIIVPPTGLIPGRVYSPAVLSGNLLYVSGQTGSDPVTRDFKLDIESQTRQALNNIRTIIESSGATLRDVAKINIFMTDMNVHFESMNAIFREYFPAEPPARCTVGVAHLARAGLLLEIEAVAVLPVSASKKATSLGEPNAALPISPALSWGQLVFISGQVGKDPGTGSFAADIAAQTRQTLENVKGLLDKAGSSIDRVLKMNIYMTDMQGEFSEMNKVFKEYFSGVYPARSTVGIAHLAKAGLKIEIDAVAFTD